jgi:hypothetical protein
MGTTDGTDVAGLTQRGGRGAKEPPAAAPCSALIAQGMGVGSPRVLMLVMA